MTQFKTFRIGDICSIKASLASVRSEGLKVPFVTCTTNNNGVLRYSDFKPNNTKYKLTITINGNVTTYPFFQSLDFASSQNVAVLDVILSDLNQIQKNALLYYVGAYFHIKEKIKYNRYKNCHIANIKNFEIQLPTKKGTIDFSYLTNLLEKIRNKLINKINKLMYDAV